MKRKITSLTVFFLLATGLQKIAYAQNTWENVVDTIKLKEVRVVDSSIIPMLDSAFTFLRCPPLVFGPYYYSLSIKEVPETSPQPIFDISLFVKEYIIVNQFSLSVFNRNYNFLFNYKGVQILIRYIPKNNDTLALKFFQPTGKKIDFYHYHKVDKDNPKFLFYPERLYVQSARFLVGKGGLTFLNYNIDVY